MVQVRDDRYRSTIINTLRTFRQPGQKVIVARAYIVPDHDIQQCELCGWPRTSATTMFPGLRNVFVLRNEATGRELRAGRNCIKIARAYIQEREPEFEIGRMKSAEQSLSAQTHGLHFDQLYDDNDFAAEMHDAEEELWDQYMAEEEAEIRAELGLWWEYYTSDDEPE